jgi:hypothetical protein
LPMSVGPRGHTPTILHSIQMPAFRHPKDHYGQLHQLILPAGVSLRDSTPGQSYLVGRPDPTRPTEFGM